MSENIKYRRRLCDYDRVRIETPLVNGVKQGIEKTWWVSTGKRHSEVTYIDGVRNGSARWRDENGKIIARAWFVNGIREYSLEEKKDLIGIKDLSQYLGVNTQTIYNWVSKNKIPYTKIGDLLRFRYSDIALWLKKNTKTP